VLVVVGVAMTGGAWWFLRAHEVPLGGDVASAPPASGRLVYTTGSPGSQRLWTWDPRTGTVTQGPALNDEVVHLISAQGALAGWLGVTTRRTDSMLEASILRTQTPTARPEHLFVADRVAWGPDGASVVAARFGGVSDGCYASLRVDRERLDLGRRETTYRRSRFCGEIPSLGQTFATTYITVRNATGTGIFFLGNGDPHEALHGWSLISTSPTSDLLVRPAGADATAEGAALFWRGAERPEPYRGGATGGVVLVDRVLSWTTAADGALVVATVDGRSGLYLLDTTPGGDRVPRYVGVLREPVAAAPMFDGSIYIASGGRLLRWSQERLTEVALPDGAPRPSGPIAWLPR
jgi:hypothetical protein